MIAPPTLFDGASGRQLLAEEAEAFATAARTMVTDARAIVLADDLAGVSRLIGMRNDAMGLLGRYQRFKHGRVFDPVVEHGTASSAIVARGLKVECVLMGECFDSYCARWSGADIPGQWAAYRADMLDTTARLLAHLEVEACAIAQLLAISELHGSVRETRRPAPALAGAPSGA